MGGVVCGVLMGGCVCGVLMGALHACMCEVCVRCACV